jgi:hypothetical protein
MHPFQLLQLARFLDPVLSYYLPTWRDVKVTQIAVAVSSQFIFEDLPMLDPRITYHSVCFSR